MWHEFEPDLEYEGGNYTSANANRAICGQRTAIQQFVNGRVPIWKDIWEDIPDYYLFYYRSAQVFVDATALEFCVIVTDLTVDVCGGPSWKSSFETKEGTPFNAVTFRIDEIHSKRWTRFCCLFMETAMRLKPGTLKTMEDFESPSGPFPVNPIWSPSNVRKNCLGIHTAMRKKARQLWILPNNPLLEFLPRFFVSVLGEFLF